MWEKVIFSDSYTLPLIKSAVDSGHARFIKPKTKDEKWTLELLRARLENKVAIDVSFKYSLLAPKVFLDGSNFGWDVYANLQENPKDPFNIDSRPLLEYTSSEFREFISLTDSHLNIINTYHMPAQEKANLYSLLEPLIWSNYQRHKVPFPRGILRFLLDILILEPRLITAREESISKFDRLAENTIRSKLVKHVSSKMVRQLVWFLSIIIIKGGVAVNEIYEAQKLNAFYPISGLSMGPNRKKEDSLLSQLKGEELIAAVGVFLKEIDSWPEINDFNDLLRLRKKKHIADFRTLLTQWINALTSGNIKEEHRIRKEIRAANNAMRNISKCSSIGKWLTYASVPLCFVEQPYGLLLGGAATVTSFGVQAISDWNKNKHKWLIVSD